MNRQEFERLYSEHYDSVRKTVLRLVKNEEDAEDVTQEAFIRASNNMDSFRGDSSSLTWVIQIALNTAKNFLLKRNRDNRTIVQFLEIEDEVLYPVSYQDISTPDSLLIAEEMGQAFGEALKELSEPMLEVFTLRHSEDKSLKEISETLDVPVGTVKSRLHRAEKTVNNKLSPYTKD